MNASGDANAERRLVKILMKHANGKSFVKYGEQMRASPRKIHKLNKLRPLINDLKTEQDNLCYGKVFMKNALKQVFVKKHKGWGLKKKHQDRWAEEMTNRIRTVNKHMADALNRESPLLWATRILNGEAEDDPDQDDGDDDVDESFDGEKTNKNRVKRKKMPTTSRTVA